MPSLYELTEQAAILMDMLEREEIDEQTLNDTLEALCAEQKIEDCCKVYRQLKANAEMYKAEKDRLFKKQRTAENGAERIRQMLSGYLEAVGKNKLEAGVFTVKSTKSVAVEITDESKIEMLYQIEQPPKIDKRAIAQAIKAGEDVPGAVLTERISCNIR